MAVSLMAILGHEERIRFMKMHATIIFVFLLLGPALAAGVQPIADSDVTVNTESRDSVDTSIGDGQLSMMVFTETASTESGFTYVCRRGADTVAYFGASVIKYLTRGTIFTLEFLGSNVVLPTGENPSGSITNYMYGNDPSLWKTGVIDYSALRYDEIYPGIDLVYKIQDGNLKYEFIASPLSDPTLIELCYPDADGLVVENQNVIIARDSCELADSQLKVFQKNEACLVDCSFISTSANSIGFNIGIYDHTSELVIDPVVLEYSTYFGGSAGDVSNAIAVDDIYMYIAGKTASSSDFPTKNAMNSSYNGGSFDAFVAKFTRDGQSLVFSTYLGGSDEDVANDIDIKDGYAYVTGYTRSADFPIINAYQDTYLGYTDAFVAKLDVDGQSLSFSTYLSGSAYDYGNAISLEDDYFVIVGRTSSSNFSAPGGYDDTMNGGYDAFVWKFSIDGQIVIYGSFLGGTDHDYANDVQLEDGFAYVTGQTGSNDFPIVNGAYHSFTGGYDCFVTKFAVDGNSLLYSTYLGGHLEDIGTGIVVEDGEVYISGYSISPDYPTVNAYSDYNGAYDCILTKLNSTGLVTFSTYLGGNSNDQGLGIDVFEGNAYIIGTTEDNGFPIVDAFGSTYSDNDDCFVTKFAIDGLSLVYSTFLGGINDDIPNSIEVVDGYAYITGYFREDGFPTMHAFDSSANGNYDCFITILSEGTDSDFDSISDWDEEYLYGTNPFSVDSDHDNYLDYYEILQDTDPLDSEHYPGLNYDIAFGTYLGGSLDDYAQAIDVDGEYVYILGQTFSSNFPTFNPMTAVINGNMDIFVLKLTIDCRSIIYSTFIGGSAIDYGLDIAVESGSAYITGYTTSTDFPTYSANDSTFNGDDDCFLTKLAPDGQSLVYSTFLGGAGEDHGNGIAVDEGCAYITGYTESTLFPIENAYNATFGGARDAFVTKFAEDGLSLIYSTFLGGSNNDYGASIDVESGNAYLTGFTSSAEFPTHSAYSSSLCGGYDGFVTKLSEDGFSLVYSTFLGGTNSDWCYGIAIEAGYAYVTGNTLSSDYPLSNMFGQTYHGNTDSFVTKLNLDGQSLIYSRFLGGSGQDYGQDIAVTDGHAYITGHTSSSDFPLTISGLTGIGDECFTTMLSANGNYISFSATIGGESDDIGNGIAVYNGTAYVTGFTSSTAFPTQFAFDQSYNGADDAFILVFGLDSDHDYLCDFWEQTLGTDMYSTDSDIDTFSDSYEYFYGSDATNSSDYPAMPQDWYDAIYEDLDGNIAQIQQIKEWLNGNYTAIQTLFTYVEGNATLLLDTVDIVGDNTDEIVIVAALAAANYDWLVSLNITTIENITLIQDVIDLLGVSIGDSDYDGLDDLTELSLGTNLQCIDTDCDNLNDAFEVAIGTNPLVSDSDLDSYLDGVEIMYGTDPLNPDDYPGAPSSTSTATTTPTSTSSNPDESSHLMLMVAVGGIGSIAFVFVLISIRKKRMSN
jgi:hypothetical protein